MPISEAYRRGFRRGADAAASLAWERKLLCEQEVKRHADAGSHDMAATERCAAREATYIWEQALKLKPKGDD